MKFGTPDHSTPSIDAVAEPEDTIQVNAQDGIGGGKVLYVNVNGATVLRIGMITGLLVFENETVRDTVRGGVRVSKTTVPVSDPVSEDPKCPKCGGRMWDNRLSKRNPKAPDYKCRSRSCDGVVWPSQYASPKSEEPPPYEGPPPGDEERYL